MPTFTSLMLAQWKKVGIAFYVVIAGSHELKAMPLRLVLLTPYCLSSDFKEFKLIVLSQSL